MLPMMCCTTTKVIYKIPDFDCPEFPVIEKIEIDAVIEKIEIENDAVFVSADWFIKVAKFKNEYKEFCEFINKAREIEVAE